MASKVSGYIGKMDPGNGTLYSLGSTAYGVCDTAAGTAKKVVDMTGFTLIEGATIFVKFTNTNSASSPTLNVNETGDKPMVLYGTTAIGTTASTNGWLAGAIICLTYDGTSWVRDLGYNTNTTYTLSGLDGVGTISASGTDPLTLSASKSGTTVTLTGSVATVSATSAGIAPQGAAVSSLTQSTKFLREDGTWATPSYTTNTNTTYTFAEGSTNGAFSVTPSGGSALSVTIHGLGSNAYTSTAYLPLAGGTMTGGVTFVGNQSSAWNDKGIIFTNGSRLGENTSGGLAIYAAEIIYLRPDSVSSSSGEGVEISTGKFYPSKNNTTDLGITKTKVWNNVYANFFHSLHAGHSSSGNHGFLIENTNGVKYANLYLHTEGTTSTVGNAALALGNSTASGNTNNARGSIYLYGTGGAYTTILNALTGSTSRAMYFPNYAGDGYLAHTAGTEKVGDTNLPVYVAANGRLTAVTAQSTANNLLDSLSAGVSTPVDGDTYIASYADGNNVAHNGTNTYHRRPIIELWNYIKGKADSIYVTSSGVTSITLKAGTGISLDTDNTAITSTGTRTISLASITKSDTTTTASPSHGGTFTAVDEITYDTYGRVTGVRTKTITLPTDNNTDTKVTLSNSETANWRKILLHYTNDSTSTATVTSATNTVYATLNISVQPSTGTIRANAYNVADHVTLLYDTSLEVLNFIFS